MHYKNSITVSQLKMRQIKKLFCYRSIFFTDTKTPWDHLFYLSTLAIIWGRRETRTASSVWEILLVHYSGLSLNSAKETMQCQGLWQALLSAKHAPVPFELSPWPTTAILRTNISISIHAYIAYISWASIM